MPNFYIYIFSKFQNLQTTICCFHGKVAKIIPKNVYVFVQANLKQTFVTLFCVSCWNTSIKIFLLIHSFSTIFKFCLKCYLSSTNFHYMHGIISKKHTKYEKWGDAYYAIFYSLGCYMKDKYKNINHWNNTQVCY